MVDRFQPNGSQEETQPPKLTARDDQIVITCSTVGASLGYRIGDGKWQLYTGPFMANQPGTITAKAVRYGWKESEEVEFALKN